ncbi:methylmalonyl-CoA epimerase [Deinococcus proteolyticus MRP]|uniref:Methylmalonyl-CoA epimerase n=1 Tax=Deinococcus proteolyticus (strain ATCC 35074 / DSM 20540 / JCM 6276 / NBRC 101906 / NCIMB 13154 / VKM Ac-1939 / CCM 2703 / MRP) TaxID=693977 RepID=F0RKY7_DEIPM|nr:MULTISPECIES: VOC family protein [Deinococcus]ADY25760.1 methylmalonyl-CoA epimerase [Deinococcus proteolyticus MRP]MCY1701884.1 VOC family protein [Deinococcus sp. SL84]
MKLQLLDHIAIAARTLDEGSAPYLALGLTPEGADEHMAAQGAWIRAFRIGDTLIELLAPDSEDSTIAKFLEKKGPGLHHTAYRVENIEAAMGEMREAGAPLLNDAPQAGRAGSRVAFLHPKWGQGTLIELVEHGHGAQKHVPEQPDLRAGGIH